MSKFSIGQMAQLANSFEGAGYTPEHLTKLGQLGEEGHRSLIAFLEERAEIVMTHQPKILRFVSEVVVPATPRFVAREKFVVNTSASAEVKISWIGPNFSSWFLEGEGKFEEAVGETTLLVHRLTERSTDGPIIGELGGEKVEETTLAEMFALMRRQAIGQKGVLLTDGFANIFYIRDCANVVRTVLCGWGGDGWNVIAVEVSGPDPWGVGLQIFSRR